MARTTSNQVASIVEVDAAIGLTPFIDTASALVDAVCADFEYTNTTLELIERWLAAHFYAIRDNRVASESAGPVSASYQYHVGAYLASTMYGQQAMLLDFKGGLAALNQTATKGKVQKPSRTAGFYYVGGSE